MLKVPNAEKRVVSLCSEPPPSTPTIFDFCTALSSLISLHTSLLFLSSHFLIFCFWGTFSSPISYLGFSTHPSLKERDPCRRAPEAKPEALKVKTEAPPPKKGRPHSRAKLDLLVRVRRLAPAPPIPRGVVAGTRKKGRRRAFLNKGLKSSEKRATQVR